MLKISNRVLKDLFSPSRRVMEKAFNIIYQEYSYLVFYIALKIVKNQEAAEDITNETFMKFYMNKENIKNISLIKNYLASTSRNLSLNYVNSQKRLEPFNEEIAQTDNKEDHYEEYIEKFKDFLNEEEIELIILHLIYEFTFKEISESKNVSINVISSKYKRTLDKVKKHYKGVDIL